MARPVSSDFLHNMRFLVTIANANGATADVSFQGGGSNTPAGFAQCSVPETSVEVVDYREGTYIYSRKQPGNPNVNDISLSRGVTMGDSSFYNWLRVVVEGRGEYRVDMAIQHFHRMNALNRAVADPKIKEAIDITAPARTYTLYNAFPTRHKFASDLDATSGEISIMELDIAYEFATVTEGNVTTVT